MAKFSPSPASLQKPFAEAGNKPASISLPMQLERLARLRPFGFSGSKATRPMNPPAFTAGAFGSIK